MNAALRLLAGACCICGLPAAAPAAAPAAPAGGPGTALHAAPNPFHAGAGRQVELRVPDAGENALTVDIFDARGVYVVALARARRQVGAAVLRWDGRDAEGRAVAPGVYLVRVLCAGPLDSTERVLRLSLTRSER